MIAAGNPKRFHLAAVLTAPCRQTLPCASIAENRSICAANNHVRNILVPRAMAAKWCDGLTNIITDIGLAENVTGK